MFVDSVSDSANTVIIDLKNTQMTALILTRLVKLEMISLNLASLSVK